MGVFVKAQTETMLTLEWNKVKNCSYVLRYSNGTETPLTVSADGPVLRYTVSSLSPGTKYTFVLYAVFKGVKQSNFSFTAVTSKIFFKIRHVCYVSSGEEVMFHDNSLPQVPPTLTVCL